MSKPKTIAPQFYLQTLSFLRNGKSLFFTLAFPIVLGALFGMAERGQFFPVGTQSTISFDSWSLLGLTAYVVLMGGFVKVAGDIAAQRDSGLLKRIRLRGGSDFRVLCGYAVSGFVVALICELVLLTSGWIFLDLHKPSSPAGVLIVGLLGAALCSTVGVAYSSFIPSAEASQMMVLVPTLILMFLSGIFEPSWMLPSSLRVLSKVFPVEYLADAMRSMWLGCDFVHSKTVDNGVVLGSGHGLSILLSPGLSVSLAWMFAAILISLKMFRWDARSGK